MQTNNTISRAVIYARFSSERQRDESIEDQMRVCAEYAERNGIEVVRTYADRAISGRTDHRPQFLQMVHDASMLDIQAVIVYKLDRFSRDQYDAAIYKKQLSVSGVRVVSATENVPETPEGIILEKLLEGMAAYYSANLAQNVKRGMEGNALNGKVNGVPPYGYRKGIDGRFEIDEEQAAVVREIYDRYNYGNETAAAISRDLASRGVKSFRGTPCTSRMVRDILKNEKYTGLYKWGDVVIPGGMPAIIDDEDYALAQAPRERRVHKSSHGYVLAGRVRCPRCGKYHAGTSGTSRHGRTYYYYRCGCCQISEAKLVAATADAIRGILSTPAEADRIIKKILEADGESAVSLEKKRLESEIKLVESKKNNLLRALEHKTSTISIVERIAELETEEKNLKNNLRIIRESEVVEVDSNLLHEFFKSAWLLDDDYLLVDAFVSEIETDGETAVLSIVFAGQNTKPASIALGGFVENANGRPDTAKYKPYALIEHDRLMIVYDLAA